MTMRGAILAGGNASRFDGRPKGLAQVGGERILDRLVNTIRTVIGHQPVLIANAPDAHGWHDNLYVRTDVFPNCGSLGGIFTAIVAGEGPVLVVAWDMPFVSAGLLKELAQHADSYDVFLPESGGPRGVEPLCGIYAPTCASAIRERLDDEDFRATGFHNAVRVGLLPLAEVAKHGDPATQFFNVNTPGDLMRAEELWHALHT